MIEVNQNNQQYLDLVKSFLEDSNPNKDWNDLLNLVNNAKINGVPLELLGDLLKKHNVPFTQNKEKEKNIPAHENVLYAPRITIIPDTHGVDPEIFGIDENSIDVVSVGDVIDAPKNLKVRKIDREKEKQLILDWAQRPNHKYASFSEAQIEQEINRITSNIEKENKAAENVNIYRSVEVWASLLESGNGDLVFGNHELMMMSGFNGNDNDLSMWLLEANKGKTTLEAFGIETENIPEPYVDENKALTPLNNNLCEEIRDKIKSIPLLSKFIELLFSKGKMYMIANEALVVHAGVPIDDDGSLIPPQRKKKSWNGFENLVGLDAFDKIEEEIKNKNLDILHWLANSSSKEMSPAWVRDPFLEIMRNDQASEKAIEELDKQAEVRGGSINLIMIGHTSSSQFKKIGGEIIGKKLLGTDTEVGDTITLDVSDGKNVSINSRHNFGKGGDRIGYYLKNEIE